MSVRINEAGHHDVAAAAHLFNESGNHAFVSPDLVGRADSNDLAALDQHGTVFDDAEVEHLRTASRASIARRTAQGHHLRRMHEQSYGSGLISRVQRFSFVILKEAGNLGRARRACKNGRSESRARTDSDDRFNAYVLTALA